MNAPHNLTTIEQLRRRDGNDCWLCGHPLSFTAPPGSRKAPTKEHLIAKSLGGDGAPDNLVLCHRGCNKQLGNRSKVEKIKMRDKRIANRAKLAARGAAVPKEVATKSVPKADPVPRVLTKATVALTQGARDGLATISDDRHRIGDLLRRSMSWPSHCLNGACHLKRVGGGYACRHLIDAGRGRRAAPSR